MGEPVIDIDKLSPAERLELLERLWDSLSDQDVPLTASQREELQARLDDLDREGPHGIPWEEVLRRLQHEAP
jgi:putative addiction module component (TIGR02574 family)